jgi:hypothetical protein
MVGRKGRLLKDRDSGAVVSHLHVVVCTIATAPGLKAASVSAYAYAVKLSTVTPVN